ncbi:MAG: L-threonylcarbamoyladenylate synthase [Chloroflexi bacterium]|nr:L-threonylcarbamoyladenylate synthase [Chloroflexota bacterium]
MGSSALENLVVRTDNIEEGVRVLRSGGVVAYPTDTVYGLGADIESPAAVRRIIDLKGRPVGMGLPLLLAETGELGAVAGDLSDVVWSLTRNFWPGSLTLVVRRSAMISDLVSGGRDTVAVRVPDHPVPRELARGLGRPITGTSANLAGQPSAVTGEEAQRRLGTRVDMIVEGGPVPGQIESTILDVTGAIPVLIRQGAVGEDDIRDYLAELGEELAVA